MAIQDVFQFKGGVFPRLNNGIGNIPRSDWEGKFEVTGRTSGLLILSGSVHWGLGAKNQVPLGFDVTVTKIPPSNPPDPPFKFWTHGYRDNKDDTAHLPLTTVHRLFKQGKYKIEMKPIDGTHVSESDIFSGHLIE